MAKKGNKFELNKGGNAHDFKLDKGARRNFDLSKDDDDDVVASTKIIPQVEKEPIIDTENLNQTVDATGNGQETGKGRSGKWIWILIVLALLAILFLFLIPKNQKDGEEETPAAVEQREAAAEEAMEAREEAEAALTPEATAVGEEEAEDVTGRQLEGDNGAAAQPEATPAQPQAPAQQAPAAKAETPAAPAQPQASAPAAPAVRSNGPVSDDIEAEARNVIRGHYGNNPDRKQALGDKYQQIQSRVNELMRGEN